MTTSIAILVQADPISTEGHFTAYHYALAAIQAGHQIHSVFFTQQATIIGSNLLCPPTDEKNIQHLWQSLSKQHGFELVLCVSAGLRRGVIDEQEQKLQKLPTQNCAAGFSLSGLTALTEALIVADKLICFK